MKIIGQMSITNFPLWKMCLKSLENICDELYIRFDTTVGNLEILDQLHDKKEFPTIRKIIESNLVWNRWNWREEMIRMIDGVCCDIVCVPDQDETFNTGIKDEILEFYKSTKSGMMLSFDSPMPTDDGRIISNGKVYPSKPHMKIYKWKPKLTYYPYGSFAKVTQYRNPNCHWLAQTKMKHWCFYTKELEDSKRLSLKKRIDAENQLKTK